MKEIRLSKSSIGKQEEKAVSLVLEKEFLGMGEEVKIFEQELGAFFERPVVCVSNGTAAMQLALQAASISLNDEVLVQSITYVASAQAISAIGAKPVFCEINPDTFTIDLEDAKLKITNKTKAIMPVHYGGNVGEIEKVYQLAKDYGLRVIEDAAHAFGSNYHGKRIGSFGDIACFSFDGIKNITSGEGGCIVTNDKEVLSRARDARLLGVMGDTQKRYKSDRSWEYDVEFQGWRYHMSNIMAAIGIEQLKKYERLSNKRKELARRYKSNFSDINSIKPIVDDFRNITPHIYPILISEEVNREDLRRKLSKMNIQTGVHYFPNHLLSFYQQNPKIKLPLSEQAYNHILSLPLHPDLNIEEIDLVSSKLIDFIGKENRNI